MLIKENQGKMYLANIAKNKFRKTVEVISKVVLQMKVMVYLEFVPEENDKCFKSQQMMFQV